MHLHDRLAGTTPGVLLLPSLLVAQSFTSLGTGPGDYSFYGTAVACAGDLDGDGCDDLVVGADSADGQSPNSGVAYVYSGESLKMLFSVGGDRPDDLFGAAVAGVGDVNGDGAADFAVGAPNARMGTGEAYGAVFVLSGYDGSRLLEIRGSSPFSEFGSAVAGAGDVNGDGYSDVIVGAPWASFAGVRTGTATIYSGFDGTVLRELAGVHGYSGFGKAVDGIGDLDYDGYDDVLVTAHAENTAGTQAGAARVYSGRNGTIMLEVFGLVARNRLGHSGAAAGDVNFDGAVDIIVGSPSNDFGGTDSGMAQVFSGLDGAELHRFVGSVPFGWCGMSVGGAGDVDGDGFDDVIVGSPNDSTGAQGGGAFEVFSGLTGTSLYYQAGTEMDASLGRAVAVAGDTDDDGFHEVIVGAPWSGTSDGEVIVAQIDGPNSPGRERTYGRPCVGSLQRMPRIQVDGNADIGHSLLVSLRGGRPNTAASLHVGHRHELSLAAFGMPGCTSYIDPVAAFQYTTASNGFVFSPMFVPVDPTIVGLELHFQWAIADALAPYAIGASLSEALFVRVGM